MSFIDLPPEIILKIIDIPWGIDDIKKTKLNYKNKNPYNSLIKVNKDFNKRFSGVDILIPMVGSYSARQFNKEHLIY